MGLVNCVECGTLCMTSQTNLCPNCYQTIQWYEEKVVEYVENRLVSTLDAIHSETGAPQKVILQLIRAGRLEPGSVQYPCEGCGQLITKGRLCSKCTENVCQVVNR